MTAPASIASGPFSEADGEYMRHALGLAALGLNTTDPNPRVGCVLVNDGRIVGEGWHERAGEAHAEGRALQSAGAAAAGATAYVTLEPCARRGRVAPCADALLAARVARVVYAVADPNPRKGGGGARLLAAGLRVESGLLEADARALNPGFFKRHERGLPFVRVKLGVSLDGRSALANGESRWITGKMARRDAQHYRARSSVVLTGIGTILGDDPAMNVRLDGASRQPLRVVLDSRLRSPPASRIFERDGPSLVIGVHDDTGRRAALETAGARVEMLAPGADGRVPLEAAMHRLAALEANEVWVEAGARLAGAILAAGLVDELVVYLAPCLLGSDARGLADLPALTHLDQRLALRFTDVRTIGDDLRVTAAVLPRDH
jgi:diaminohydroxyphosphoribosylaminopyrimidine deaminase/5-amino-6-(5-phosphoribosylamino)uracil reductase